MNSGFWELEEYGRARLSKNYYMRDFLYSELSNAFGVPNVPDFPDVAVEMGRRLCQEILEPLVSVFGRVHIRSGYRSAQLNGFGASKRLKCAPNPKNFAYHIWDHPDANGNHGAAACVVIPWFQDRAQRPEDWQQLSWFIHDHLPYHRMTFFAKQTAFNIGWHQAPLREIYSTVTKQWLTRDAMPNAAGDHRSEYAELVDWLRQDGRPNAISKRVG